VSLERELRNVDETQLANDQQGRLKSRQKDIRACRQENGQENGQRHRQTILSEIQSKLRVYSETLKDARDLGSFQKPSKRDYKSVRTWFWNNAPLVGKEQEFIKMKEDILSLHSGREWSTFDAIVEKLLLRLQWPIIAVSCVYVSMIRTQDLQFCTENIFDA
jgi:hypothetical protein